MVGRRARRCYARGRSSRRAHWHHVMSSRAAAGGTRKRVRLRVHRVAATRLGVGDDPLREEA